MIFNDEPRFSKDVKPNRFSDIAGYGKSETANHVGPGSYFSSPIDNKRNGWGNNSFSKKQPMSPNSNRIVDRSIHYRSGAFTNSGILSPGSALKPNTPGPGQYEGSIIKSPSSMRRPTSAASKEISTFMGQSPRIARTTAVIRNGILFESTEVYNGVGPGYYNASTPDHSLLKRSHNIRVRSPNKISSSPRRSSDSHVSFGGSGNANGSPNQRDSPAMKKLSTSSMASNPQLASILGQEFSPQSYAIEAYEFQNNLKQQNDSNGSRY